jgi:hypothetical protein
MNADAWLTTVFAPALERESLAYTNDADLLRGQLAALHDCEVLDENAWDDARRRLDAAVEVAHRRARFDVRPPGTTEDASAAIVTLHRVLAVAQPLADVDGMPILVTSVELWSSGVDMFLAGLPTPDAERHVLEHSTDLNDWGRKRREGRSGEGALSPPQLRGNRFFELDVRIRDDVGTGYRIMGGSAGGSQTEWRMNRHYEPGVPEHATQLTVEIADHDGNPIGRLNLAL